MLPFNNKAVYLQYILQHFDLHILQRKRHVHQTNTTHQLQTKNKALHNQRRGKERGIWGYL